MGVVNSLDEALLNPTEEHGLLRQTVRDFVLKEVEPQAEAHDESGQLNKALLRRCGELGLLGITVPEEAGGAGMDATASVIAHEELAWSDPGFTLAYLAHAVLFVNNFYWAATPEQRVRYLPRVLSGEWIGAMGMTEPAVGTDVLGMKSVARKKSGGYVLDGRKTFITNAPEASVFLVYAKLEGRITTFVVERGFAGFSTGAKIDKLGMRASTMAELIFDGCRVPAANLLGSEGDGFALAMRVLDRSRGGIAAQATGIAEGAADYALRYAKERETMGQPIAQHQLIAGKLADMDTACQAARALLYRLGLMLEAGVDGPELTKASAQAKLFCSDTAMAVTTEAVQILGGYGYIKEYPVERMMRDAKITQIYEGTNEIQRLVIARELVRLSS